MREIPLVNEQFYHIFNRGVDKREIFLGSGDYRRFLYDMEEFNDERPINRLFRYAAAKDFSVAVAERRKRKDERVKLVDVVCFCLMPNHFHFILRQVREGGISLFMHKLSGGFAHYFNIKYERSGTLFQGKFKAKLIETDEHLMHLSRYIHLLNPGELIEPKIREGAVEDKAELKKFLKSYKWSSYMDYLGVQNYFEIINKSFLMNYFKDAKDYEKFVMSWTEEDLFKTEYLVIE